MAGLQYPKKPWSDGQKAYLIPGVQFVYSLSMKKWVPVTPGFSSETQIEEAFGVKTAEEVDKLFVDVETLKEEMIEFGRIWKTPTTPDINLVNTNDVWIDPVTGVMVYWNGDQKTWIQIKNSYN